MLKKVILLFISILYATIFHTISYCTTPSIPRVSIITSLYKGELFIEGFMHDITQQTIFNDCELIIINANSPENEEPIINKYMALFPNIIYKKLDYDPGIYSVWNMAIQMAKALYITNANLDDRLKADCYEVHARTLDQHPDIDLVYSDFIITRHPNETFEKNNHVLAPVLPEFSKKICAIAYPIIIPCGAHHYMKNMDSLMIPINMWEIMKCGSERFAMEPSF